MGLKFHMERWIMDLEAIVVLLFMLCLWNNGDKVLKLMHYSDSGMLNLGNVKDWDNE